MLAAIADTHSAIWYLFAAPSLSRNAKNTIDKAAEEGFYVGISVISLAEIVYLLEKKRIWKQSGDIQSLNKIWMLNSL